MFIELQTTAFNRTIKCNKGTTFQLTGVLGAGEVIAFEQPNGDGGWIQMVVDGDNVEISQTNTIVSFHQPALIRVSKPITVAACGVMVVS